MRNPPINMVKLNIATMRSIKIHSQTNGDVLAWYILNKNDKESQKEAQKRLNEVSI